MAFTGTDLRLHLQFSTADVELCRRSTLYPLPTDEHLESRAVAGSSLIPVDFLVLIAYSPASWWTTNVRRLGCQVARRSMTRSYSPFRAHQVDPERPMGLTSWGVQQVLVPREPGPMFHADVPSRQGSQGFPLQAIAPIPSHPQQLDGPNPDAQQPLFTLWITRPWELYLNRPSVLRSNLGANHSPPSAPPHSMLPYRAVTYRLREDTRIGKV